MENKSENSSEMENYQPVKSIDEEFTRTNHHLNSYGFTEQQLIQREQDMKTMCQAYPNLTVAHAELIWNYVTREGTDKIQENIKNGVYDEKSNKYLNGGIVKSGRIYNKDEEDPMEKNNKTEITCE